MYLANLLTVDGVNRAGFSGFQAHQVTVARNRRRWHWCVMKQDVHMTAEVTLALISTLAHFIFLEK